MVYAYAAMKCGLPFMNVAPNLSQDCPALRELAELLQAQLDRFESLLAAQFQPSGKAFFFGFFSSSKTSIFCPSFKKTIAFFAAFIFWLFPLAFFFTPGLRLIVRTAVTSTS